MPAEQETPQHHTPSTHIPPSSPPAEPPSSSRSSGPWGWSPTLPNLLTLGRLAVVPVFALLLMLEPTPMRLWIAAGVFVAACITDILDGRIARARNQVSEFGIMADPIADKALVGSALIGLSMAGVLPWWATALILAREIAITIMRSALSRHGMIPASRGGKIKAITQNFAVMAYLIPLSGVLVAARLPLLLVAVATTMITGLDYAREGAALRRSASA